jgi:hypothetical protein
MKHDGLIVRSSICSWGKLLHILGLYTLYCGLFIVWCVLLRNVWLHLDEERRKQVYICHALTYGYIKMKKEIVISKLLLGLDMDNCACLIIPMCHRNHWTAAVILGLLAPSNCSHPVILHFDSLGYQNYDWTPLSRQVGNLWIQM